jgi:hypothetical protein
MPGHASHNAGLSPLGRILPYSEPLSAGARGFGGDAAALMLPFTMEEAWIDGIRDSVSVHLEQFPELPGEWRNDALSKKWRKI